MIIPVVSLSVRGKTGDISREWSVDSFSSTTLAFEITSVYYNLTLLCKVYYFEEFVGDAIVRTRNNLIVLPMP